MLTQVITIIFNEHDVRVLGLASLISLICAFAAVMMAQRARESAESDRWRWLLKSAVVVGGGFWATHFMAMLGWDQGLAIGHGFWLNLMSGAVMIASVGIGLYLATYNRTKRARLLAGLLVGAGMAMMHYIELQSLSLQGQVATNSWYNLVAGLAALLLAGVALVVMNKTYDRVRQLLATALLASAPLALHMVAMAGTTVSPDASLPLPDRLFTDVVLGFGVSIGALAVLGFSLAMVVMDIHITEHQSVEVSRLQSLADAAIEGIVVVDYGGHIVDANPSFLSLVCHSIRQLRGQDFARYFHDFPQGETVTNLAERAEHIEETTLLSSVGEEIPTELFFKCAIVSGEPHNVVIVRDLRERRAAEQRINYLANYDVLTGLANRQLMMDRLGQSIPTAQAHDQKVILHFIDLDFFKEMNTTVGQQNADQLLKFFAGRISSVMRGMVIVSRIGADQFCVVQEGVASAESAELLLERLRRKLNQPFSVAGLEVKITVCVGTAVAPDDADDPNILLARAEIAMKKAKAIGRGNYCFYEESVDKAQEERRRLKLDLASALEKGELFLLYQPQFDCDTGIVTGFEALVRWRHPALGLISPAEFIPLAEESGAIVDIGDWILDEACREAAQWDNPLRIAVNLSPVQFLEDNLGSRIAETIQRHGLAPERLELEITEGVLIEDEARALDMLRALRAKGVLLAMDDFGTGYSSLSYLRQFPFDKLKIDRSFILNLQTDPQALGIVKGMIGLAHGLDIPVLAEGVETESQLAMLRLEHGDEVQGYYTGKPKPIDEYAALVQATAGQKANKYVPHGRLA
ncbi:bifunctional diguanylate cyclase/phosphodiesterase [Kordiimonas lacus]|uniref:PAS domain S-box-containing protein/diguanylate cyclase (GGDEF) domain-containing protein n=1 Tax=Kordiimonas lacus TaxID=637679 RepID=A0A1G6Y372_9PROT|nr:EAL domain-containing protein [Kordiimonas lacus]SDD84393.1 PAS domain S-box-containing protein/diguanylate cyclase (GGDEF) domain-containing protein [Kordiimonas lacus]